VHVPFFELDGALIRIRLPGGALAVAAAQAIASVVTEVGAGPLELTNRANLQVRGIPIDAVAVVRDAVVAAGLAAADPHDDERRNVLASPTAGVDADEVIDTRPLVAQVADRLGSRQAVGLSPKFGVLVDGGGAVHVRGRRHDLALGAVRGGDGTVRYEVQVGEGLPLAREPDEVVWSVAPAQALGVVAAVLNACAPFGRANDLVAALGRDRVWADIVGRTGDALTCRSDLAGPSGATGAAVGVVRQRQAGRVWIGIAPLLGRLEAATLRAIAELADEAAGAPLRITPWRGVVLTDVAEPDAAAVVAACEQLGLTCDPAHPANLVVACAGNRGCAAGLADTQADARALVARLADLPAEQRPRSVHVSGCDKGCARAQPAQVSLVAGSPSGTYDLYADRQGAPSPRFGEQVVAGLDPQAAIDAVTAQAPA
jgi:precorrin-3B synthase